MEGKIFASGLQITVGYRTMADQNLPMSEEIATLVWHLVQLIFCCNIWLYQLQRKFDFLVRYSFEYTFVFMFDQIFLLSNQNGALVRHMSFQGKKIICSPVTWFKIVTCNHIAQSHSFVLAFLLIGQWMKVAGGFSTNH